LRLQLIDQIIRLPQGGRRPKAEGEQTIARVLMVSGIEVL
jgi:hypothetical protein